MHTKRASGQPIAARMALGAGAGRVRIAGKHRLHPVPRDLRQVGIVDASGAKVGDIAVAALVGADV